MLKPISSSLTFVTKIKLSYLTHLFTHRPLSSSLDRQVVEDSAGQQLSIEVEGSADGGDGVQVQPHVVVCIHNHSCSRAVFCRPEKTHHILVGEIVIGVDEVSLHNICLKLKLLLHLSLAALLRRAPQEENHSGVGELR